MFEGELGKQMMIKQGYVPANCTLPVEIAGPLIWDEVNKHRSPCWGCNGDRSLCSGQAKRDKDKRW